MNTNDAPVHPTGNPPVAVPVAENPPAGQPRPARNFFHSLRDDRPRWWKPVLIAVLLVVGYLIGSMLLSGVAIGIEVARGVVSLDDLGDPSGMPITPLIFGSSLAALAVLWPWSLLLQKMFYRDRPIGALYSVLNRFRWRWAFTAAAITLVVQAIYYGIAMIFFPGAIGLSEGGGPDNPWPWLLTVVITMPVQAAAEEVAFRGLLGRSIGSLFARAGVAVGVALGLTAIVFGQAHAASDPWLIAYYTGFGLLMGVVTWKTGGIEVAVALHVVNNLLSGGLGAVFSDLTSGIDRSVGNGSPAILVHLAVLTAIGAGLVWLARRQGLAVETSPEQSGPEQQSIPAGPAAAWTPTPQRRTVARDDRVATPAPDQQPVEQQQDGQ